MSSVISKKSDDYLYQQVINLITLMQEEGNLHPGDKLPSLRKLSNELEISVPTVKQAYLELERLGKVEARPKSGYFLKAAHLDIASPRLRHFKRRPVAVRCQTLVEKVYTAIHGPNSIPLGIAHPVMAHPPYKALARIQRRVLSNAGAKTMAYGPMDGYQPLKRLLAQRYLEQGVNAHHEHLVITNGAQEALAIAVQCIAQKGDVIAVESPTYFGILELIENLGMMALEIPTGSEGICLDDLEYCLDSHPVTGCIFSSSINNPTGYSMDDKKRRKLVEMLEARDLPLIEDDVYGELHFDDQRPQLMQAFSTKGQVITCSSFSKTAAPSYRVGWLLSEKYEQRAKGLKRAMSCSSSLLNQWVLYEFLRSGDFDRHNRQLRQVLRTNKERMRALVAQHFPEKTCVTDPAGGGVLWVEMPSGCESAEFFERATEQGISVTPGELFSPRGKYKRCVRLSYGLPWTEEVEDAVKTLGNIAYQLVTT